MASDQPRALRGFTLVETVLAIVVAGLLLGLAVPRFTAMRNGLRLDGAAYQLAGDLRRAQVEAIKRNQSVALEKTGASTYTIQFIGARSFEQDVAFGAGSIDSVRMAPFGPPLFGGVAFTVSHAGREKTITVSASGLVTVQ